MSPFKKITLDLSSLVRPSSAAESSTKPPLGINELMAQVRGFGLNTANIRMADIQLDLHLDECGLEDWQFVCELPAFPMDCPDIQEWVWEQVMGCMGKLRTYQLHAVLLAEPTQIDEHGGADLLQALHMIRQGELSQKIGISLRSPRHIPDWAMLCHFDIVKIPDYLIGGGPDQSKLTEQLASQGLEIYSDPRDKTPGKQYPGRSVPYKHLAFQNWVRHRLAQPSLSRLLLDTDAVLNFCRSGT